MRSLEKDVAFHSTVTCTFEKFYPQQLFTILWPRKTIAHTHSVERQQRVRNALYVQSSDNLM